MCEEGLGGCVAGGGGGVGGDMRIVREVAKRRAHVARVRAMEVCVCVHVCCARVCQSCVGMQQQQRRDVWFIIFIERAQARVAACIGATGPFDVQGLWFMV